MSNRHSMRPVYSAEEIADAVKGLADEINRDYAGREILFVAILNGAFIFAADLVRLIKLDCIVDFVRLSSYGGETSSSGKVDLLMERKVETKGRHVIVLDEIVDSGLTLTKLLARLRDEEVASLAVCALVDKRGRRRAEVEVTYSGFVLDDGFLLGYGLDYDEIYRNLPAIYELAEEDA